MRQLRGSVSWFDNGSGEGYLKSDAGQLYYVHYSVIKSEESYKTLKDGQRVEFEVVEDETFRHTMSVIKL